MSTFYAPSIISGTGNTEIKKTGKTTNIITIIMIISITVAGNTSYIVTLCMPLF